MRSLPTPRGPASELLIARALDHLDRLWSAHVLRCWNEDRTSLRRELGDPRGQAAANPVLASS